MKINYLFQNQVNKLKVIFFKIKQKKERNVYTRHQSKQDIYSL